MITTDTVLTIQQAPIDTVIPYARNPRKNTTAITQVASSLKEFGFRQPIVVDKEMVVVVGHTRLLAAKQLGYTEVPIHIATTLTPQQIKAYRIADNRTNEFAEWDLDFLKLEMEETGNLFTGFTDEDLNELFDTGTPAKGNTDENEVPETPINPVSQLGDVWILGDHRLICGDSTSDESISKLMGNDTADLVWTDPPYNVAYVSPWQSMKARQGSSSSVVHTEIANDDLSDEAFQAFLTDAFNVGFSKLKKGGAVYVSYCDKESVAFKLALAKSNIMVKANLIWKKDHLMLSMLDYHPIHEPILYGWKEGAAHYFIDDRTQTNVFDSDTAIDPDKMSKEELVAFVKSLKVDVMDFKRTKHNDLHPTMKPIDLLQTLITNSSKPKEIVLDFFGSSGSTLIACETIGRKARLCELEPKYVDVIVTRWEEFTGNKAILEGEEGKSFQQVKEERLV